MEKPASSPQPRQRQQSRLERFTAWRLAHVPDNVTLVVAAGIIGVAAGMAACILKLLISGLTGYFAGFIHSHGPNYAFLIIPVIGILLASCYQRYIARRNLMHGEKQLTDDLRRHNYRLPYQLTYEPLVASSITLGFGGSAGGEGPIASAGAALGSNIARLLGLSPSMMRILIGCGAGAGIAGIFKSPVGGALFTMEVLKMNLTTVSMLSLLVAAVCGALVCFACTGFTPDINFVSYVPFDSGWMVWILGLGAFCGLYSIYYSGVLKYMQRFFRSIANPWLMNLAGGAILATCVFAFPVLFGEGYDVMTRICNDDFRYLMYGSVFEGMSGDNDGTVMIILMVGVLLLKCFATVASNSAGGVAGDFAPTIFAGAIAGYVFASAANLIFDAGLPVGVFALIGTAGVFAGVIHAPLMAMFLTAEMSNGYGFLLGLATCATVSYIIVKVIRPKSIYETLRHDDFRALIRFGRTKKKA